MLKSVKILACFIFCPTFVKNIKNKNNMLHFKNNYYLNEVQKELPKMLTIQQTKRLMRTRKKYALLVGENMHLTNEPEMLYIKKYFFSKLSKTTLIILN